MIIEAAHVVQLSDLSISQYFPSVVKNAEVLTEFNSPYFNCSKLLSQIVEDGAIVSFVGYDSNFSRDTGISQLLINVKPKEEGKSFCQTTCLVVFEDSSCARIDFDQPVGFRSDKKSSPQVEIVYGTDSFGNKDRFRYKLDEFNVATKIERVWTITVFNPPIEETLEVEPCEENAAVIDLLQFAIAESRRWTVKSIDILKKGSA